MKGYVLVDIPESCSDCILCFRTEYSDYCSVPVGNQNGDVYNYQKNKMKPDWCPIKELPTKDSSGYCSELAEGYNMCIDDILEN